jgi:Carboxypeptidase regulatory-like domain/TonB dependent receptor
MLFKSVSHRVQRLFAQLLFVGLLAGIMQLLTGPSLAQSTFGEFVGTVKDPSGALIAGCRVTVKNLGTSATRTAITDSSGSYIVVNLEPGDYEITMEMQGFQRFNRTNIQLLSRETLRIDGALPLASQAQAVEVNVQAEAPISTEVSNIAETKLGRELIDLPVALGSRAQGSTSAFATLTTQPGVEIDNNGNISIAGANLDMLSMSIDGISTMSPRNSAPMTELFPSFDGISEIRVGEINNTAEFGGISDVTTISKGGGNQYHGGVFENHQNSAFAARNTFSDTVPKLIMNDFGAFVGGPISIPGLYNGKDRTFFFMDYEGLRLPRQTVLLESVPSVPLRNGDLSAYPDQINDVDGTPFPGNRIPASRINSVSSGVLKYLFPLPNTGPANAVSNNYVENFPVPIVSNQGDMRLDQKINPKQSVFARFTYKRKGDQRVPCNTCASTLNGTPLGGAVQVPENDWSLTGAHNWVINPRIVNEFRAGWTGLHQATSFGISGSQIEDQLGLTPYIQQAHQFLTQVNTTPSIEIAGFQRTGRVGSNRQQTQTYQFLDNLSWIQGTKHTVKLGGDFRYLTALYTSVFDSWWLGRYRFSKSVTGPVIGNPYAAFLLGVPSSDSIATVLYPDTNAYGKAYALYAQDDWKVTPHLTVNFGLRWEYHPMFEDHNRNVAAFLPGYYTGTDGTKVHGAVAVPNGSLKLVNPAFAQSIVPTPILTADQAGIPNSLRYSQKTDFAPRVGFAWRATGDGKTVIRGGYGRYIDSPLGYLILSSWAVEASDVASFTNSINSGKARYTFPYPFPQNLAQPGTQDFDLSYALHYKDPYVQQWNFTIERDLGFQTGVRLSYDGSRGSNLSVTTNPDQVPANTIGFSKASANAPYPLWDSLVNVENSGRSNYQSFTISINKRMSKGLQFLFSYNHAKNLSNAGGWNPTQFVGEGGGQTSDYYSPNIDYGRVPFTRNHRVIANFLYETSSHTTSRLLNQVVGGWEVAGRFLFQTGPYLSVTAPGTDPSGTNFDNSFNGGDPRADIIPNAPLYPTNRSIHQWVNPAAFALPPDKIGRFGDSPVGAVVGPGTQVISISIYRSFRYKERYALRIGASSTNLFNHPNYGVPNLGLGTDPFGKISSLQTAEDTGPRAIQLGGRLTF